MNSKPSNNDSGRPRVIRRSSLPRGNSRSLARSTPGSSHQLESQGSNADNNYIVVENIDTQLQEPQSANQSWPPMRTPKDKENQQVIWLPKEVTIADLIRTQQELTSMGGAKSKEPSKPAKSPSSEDKRDPRYVLQKKMEENEETSDEVKKAKKESLLKWFDKNVENELKKRRDTCPAKGTVMDPALNALRERAVSIGALNRLAEASASRIDIASRVALEPNTELSDAVDKLAQAEAMCKFAGAVQAAENAAENAPPEMVEEAAAEGARLYQAEITSTVRQDIPGSKPIEIIGYVGITRPKYPVKNPKIPEDPDKLPEV